MKRNSKSTFYLFTLILFFLVISPIGQGATLENREELEAFFDGVFAIQTEQYRVPGISVAVIKDGEVILSKGYGFADLEKKIPIDPTTTLHRPGSNSKILVWTAVMQLMEEGQLDIYADINTYLDFDIPTTLSNGKEVSPITLHHLFTHTAGFEDMLMGLFATHPDTIPSLEDYVRDYLPGRVFPPGKVMGYSNYGTALAAYIVEKVSELPFEEYVQANILDPLQMTSSTFAQPLPEHLSAQMSNGYLYQAGKYVPVEFEYLKAYPAGSLTSTTMEMANLMIAHLQLGIFGEERILKEETARLMQTTQFRNHPDISGMTYGFIEADYNGHRVLSHGGNTMFFHTGLYFLPEEQVGLYVSYNSQGGPTARLPLFESFMDRYFPGTEVKTPVPRPIQQGTESNYLGVFHSSRSNYTRPESCVRLIQPLKISVDQDYYLLLQIGNEITRYGEIAPNLFQEVSGKGKMGLTFQDGQVTEIHFSGPDTWLRTLWYQTPAFIGSVVGFSSLLMLIIVISWIKQLFRPRRNHQLLRIPKLIGLFFIIVFFTSLVLIVDATLDTHPELGIPMIILESSTTLKTILLLTKLLMGLNILMVIATVYLWFAKKGSLWQRFYYTVLTLSTGSVIWVFWQFKFL